MHLHERDERALRNPRGWTLDGIKAAHRAQGGYWFEPATMRFFSSRVSGNVHQGPGGIFFVSSERAPHGARRYTVRRFSPETAGISTVGEMQAFGDRRTAHGYARRLASGECEA